MTLNSWSPLESSARRGVLCTQRSLAAWLLRTAGLFLFLACLLTWSPAGFAQQTSNLEASSSTSALPDAPQGAQTSASQSVQPSGQKAIDDERLPQTKRILGIIPNFRSVSTDETLPPQTVKDKFMDATSDSFDYSSILLPAAIAGLSMARNSYPEFHQGAAGYARYFWHSAVDQTSENYLVEFVGPVVTREDSRYYTLGRGGFVKRASYAVSRAFVTRTDGGGETFNFSEVVGSGAAAGLSSLYYPTRERSFGNTGSQWGLDVGIDAAAFVVREFWPDINRRLLRGRNSINGTER
jgi:hypothetical protein